MSLCQSPFQVQTATWAAATGTVTGTTSTSHGFYPGQKIIFDSPAGAVSGIVFIVATASGTNFTATGAWYPISDITFGYLVNGNPVLVWGTSMRVVWGTDNTAAIQAAVDSAASTSNDNQTGAVILFPPGHYLTHGVIADCTYVGYNSCTRQYNNFWFQGSGQDTTTLENWDPNLAYAQPTPPAHPQTPYGIFDLGYYGVTRDGEGSYYNHLLQSPKVTGFTLIQVENPADGQAKTLSLGPTQNADVSDNYFTGPSYECIYGGGANDKIHDNHFGRCGVGGPSTSAPSSAINIFGGNDYMYNNRIEGGGICTELSGIGQVFEGNYCGNAAVSGKGLVIGSVAGGVWNITVRDNSFTNMYQACAIQNGNGTLDRVHITNNTFINSSNCSLQDGTTPPVGYPVVTPDSVVHGFSEFSHNTMIEGYVAISSHYEKWVVDANTIITNNSIPAGYGNSPSYISMASNDPYWLSSHAYAASASVQRIRPRPDNDIFLLSATGACTSGSSEPSWVTTAPFVSTTTDGGCTWTYQGKMPVHQLSNNRIIGIGGGTKLSNGVDNQYCQEFLMDMDPERVQMENNSISYPGGCLYQRTPNRPKPVIPGTGGTFAQNMRIPANTPVSDSARYSWYNASNWVDLLPTNGYYQVGQQIWQYKPSTNFMWTVIRTGYAAPVWAKGQSYYYMSLVVPSADNGHFYAQVVTAGCTSGGSQPTFPTGTDATVNDNTCTWREVGTAAAFTLH